MKASIVHYSRDIRRRMSLGHDYKFSFKHETHPIIGIEQGFGFISLRLTQPWCVLGRTCV